MPYEKNYLLKFLITIVCGMLFCSCGIRNETLFYKKNQKIDSKLAIKIIDAKIIDSINTEQEIAVGNILSIRNLQNETGVLGYSNNLSSSTSSSSDYRVENDGTVSLPFLGKVAISGLKINEAELALNKLYANNLLKDPLIKIKITNLKVTVLGEFNRQGNIPLNKNNTHLTEIIGEAGGLNNRANPRTIKIIRGDLKKPTVILVNLNKIESLQNQVLYIRDNDIIYVKPKNSASLLDKLVTTGPIIGLATTILSLYLIIDRL